MLTNLSLDRFEEFLSGRGIKSMQMKVWQANRATLASEPMAIKASMRGSIRGAPERHSRATHYSLEGDVRGSIKARKAAETVGLKDAVAKLADLVSGLAGENPEVRSAVSEIIANVGGAPTLTHPHQA